MNFTYKSPLFAISLSFVGLLFYAASTIERQLKKPSITISKQSQAINLNHKLINLFSLGQNRFISSALWIKTLLDSDLEHYKKKDLNSWMYLRFNTIAKLDPLFYENYLFGGQYLSVIKDDDLGAAKIYERGLKIYPHKYWLHFYAASHYFTELKNYGRALELYEKILYHPDNKIPYLASIVAKLKVKAGLKQSAFDLLLIAYKKTKKGDFFHKKYFDSLYSLKADIDLKCLNTVPEKEGLCDPLDFSKNPYLYNNGKWMSKIPTKTFQFSNH